MMIITRIYSCWLDHIEYDLEKFPGETRLVNLMDHLKTGAGQESFE